MEVTQRLHNFEFKTQIEFEDMLERVDFSLQDLSDLYQAVHTIAYPINFFISRDHISQDVKDIVSQIPSGHQSISYGLLLCSISDAIARHPDFVQDEDDIPF